MKQIVAVLEDGSEVPGSILLEDWSQDQFAKAGEDELLMLSRAYQARVRRIERTQGKKIWGFRYVEAEEKVEGNL